MGLSRSSSLLPGGISPVTRCAAACIVFMETRVVGTHIDCSAIDPQSLRIGQLPFIRVSTICVTFEWLVRFGNREEVNDNGSAWLWASHSSESHSDLLIACCFRLRTCNDSSYRMDYQRCCHHLTILYFLGLRLGSYLSTIGFAYLTLMLLPKRAI